MWDGYRSRLPAAPPAAPSRTFPRERQRPISTSGALFIVRATGNRGHVTPVRPAPSPGVGAMASTGHKVALVSCVVLCSSVIFSKLYTPRGTRDKVPPPEANLNRFSPMMQRPKVSQQKQQWSVHPHFPGSQQAETAIKTKGGNSGGGNKSFMAQIIPVYGFGLFMYVLYILFKISSKSSTSSPKGRKRCRSTRTGNVKRKITDYELAQLQEKLKETEVAMEKLVLKMGTASDKITSVTTEQEEKLLRHLKEITRVIKKGQLFEGISPEKEAEESPYMEDWEGGPEETCQNCSGSEYSFPHDTNPNIPESNELSAEELAEGFGTREDDCSSSETIEDQMRQSKIYQTLDYQSSTQVGMGSQNDSVEVEEEMCEGCEYFNQESDDLAIIAENFLVSSEVDEVSAVDDQIRDESIKDISIGEQQQVIICKGKSKLRKRSKVVIK